MISVKDGHIYRLSDNTILHFKHTQDGMNFGQLTSCELLDVLEHRIVKLNAALPCNENLDALFHLRQAKRSLEWRHQRIAKEKGAKHERKE